MADAIKAGGPLAGGRWRWLVWGPLLALELTPLVAMRFTGEVDWSAGDFATFGGLLLIVGGAVEVAVRASAAWAYRAAFGLATLAGFLMVWANLAVGIVGNEDNKTNLIFYGIVLTGLVGAFVAELRPSGMARTMVALAAVQGLAAVVVGTGPEGFPQLYVFSAVYAAIWLTCAWLFHTAAKQAG